MVPAVDFHIITNNITFRNELAALVPAPEDGRVFNKKYESGVIIPDLAGEIQSPVLYGSVKFNVGSDATSILNIMKQLVEEMPLLILPGSWLGLHSCNDVEDGNNESCTMEIIWSN
jgi:hypothetical protein